MSLTFGSVCSGIEAASAAWLPLGWRCAFMSEIEAFPRAVLAHHYPETPLHGDFTTIQAGQYEPIDLLVGGTPCQSFSIAGLRGGLDDDRGNLALEYLRLADRLRPRWLVWENVPGVLSSSGGRDFGAILGGMVELGYGIAYRVLDAQFFGLAQRRRRVFVVGYIGDWRRAAAVLFERHSLSGDSAPSRETGEGVAPTISARAKGGGGLGTDFDCDGGLIAPTLNATYGEQTGQDYMNGLVAFGWQNSARQGDSVSEHFAPTLDKSKTPAVAFSITPSNSNKDYNARKVEKAQALTGGGNRPSARGGDLIAFAIQERAVAENLRQGPQGKGYQADVAYTLEARNKVQAASTASAVRRLTPRECERLQGFPDDYTAIPYRGKPASDGPRYKALGNSMAVPVMAWIGRRIAMVEALATLKETT